MITYTLDMHPDHGGQVISGESNRTGIQSLAKEIAGKMRAQTGGLVRARWEEPMQHTAIDYCEFLIYSQPLNYGERGKPLTKKAGMPDYAYELLRAVTRSQTTLDSYIAEIESRPTTGPGAGQTIWREYRERIIYLPKS